MRLRTDDDIYRARLVYLGPPGYALPVQLPYAQYALFALFAGVFIVGRYLLTWQWTLIPAWEIALAIVATSVVFRYVDPDRPARKVIYVLATDWRRAPVPDGDQRLPALTGRKILIRSLDL